VQAIAVQAIALHPLLDEERRHHHGGEMSALHDLIGRADV
jgi:hypothetical protein